MVIVVVIVVIIVVVIIIVFIEIVGGQALINHLWTTRILYGLGVGIIQMLDGGYPGNTVVREG